MFCDYDHVFIIISYRKNLNFNVKQYFITLHRQFKEVLDYVTSGSEAPVKAIYKRAVSGLAQATTYDHVESYYSGVYVV